MTVHSRRLHKFFGALSIALMSSALPAAAWEPTQPVEFIVPAGTGGGADQMARVIQGIITKHHLMPQPMLVINKSGGAGGEGLLDAKSARGNPHKLIITLSNLFTTPLATGIPFNWKDLTPVAMMALDEFVLWVNADTPYKTARDYIAAAKAAPAGQADENGWDWDQAGRSDHHRRHRKKHRGEIHLRSVQGWRRSGAGARRRQRGFHGQQSDRSGDQLEGRRIAPALRVRQQAAASSRRRSPTGCPGAISPAASRKGSMSNT